MSTQQELAARLETLTAQLTKIGDETTALLAEVQSLEDAVANNPVAPEVQQALDRLTAKAQEVDDLVADVTPGPPPEPTP